MYPDFNLNKETDSEIYFFTNPFYPLDNFSAHAIELWDRVFPTVEHAYQWKKFSLEPEIAERIYSAKSPHAVKQISDAKKHEVSPTWHVHKAEVMEEIFRAKLQQHQDVKEILFRTKGKILIENSPVDAYWGIGPRGDGENIIGKLWMKLRSELK